MFSCLHIGTYRSSDSSLILFPCLFLTYYLNLSCLKSQAANHKPNHYVSPGLPLPSMTFSFFCNDSLISHTAVSWDSTGIKSPSEQQAAGTDECLKSKDLIFMQMSLAITKKWRPISSVLEAQAELFLKVDCLSKFSIRNPLLKHPLCTEPFPTWGGSLIHMHDRSPARDAICRSASHLHSLWSGEHQQGGSAEWKYAVDCSWASNGRKYLWNKATQIDRQQNKDTIEAKCGGL